MNSVTKIAAIVATTLLAGTATGATLDYRAEHKHEDDKYAHRIKIGGSTKIADETKLYFSVEQKFAPNAEGDIYNQLERGDSEFDWGVRYALDEKWYLQPGMPITFGDEKMTLKPQFRVGYKADFGLTTALRYRHEFQNYTDSSSSSLTKVNGDKIALAGETVQQGKFTLTGAYKFQDEDLKNLQLSYEANYVKSYEDQVKANGEDWEWDLGVKIGYKFDNLRPYVEFWTSDYGSAEENERQLKTRVGVTYSF
ncbi:oligogalacturonate-specific porin KdgM family protein [Vibrio lentus]|uniref:oligogalacturonate-specific porin KdgM family protein n=1 Tax=Vibrio lentus TaxID=136468 RepID=UPI0007EEC609|nr:oligogalacturonate-specific porin KdgM family protein [Vibrio lentus]OBT25791.1 hypothetical protein A9266_21940 [Vibrio tasmaniensis]MDN3630980.1 oligogalacturonate-specific porin KdgM family protein [Vibrio lentus]PMG19134.1 hypothetical protein BCU96_10005 [Vibrio lentus]PMH16460.1 hypothetical protein BCU76_00795 [Vibrio lentus]PMH30802.1 hypothetical protein BCU71_15345 [Vibrio lentus]